MGRDASGTTNEAGDIGHGCGGTGRVALAGSIRTFQVVFDVRVEHDVAIGDEFGSARWEYVRLYESFPAGGGAVL